MALHDWLTGRQQPRLLTHLDVGVQVAAPDAYSRFREDGNTAIWESLIICARSGTKAPSCPICHEEMSADSYMTSCKHAFHKGCLAAWHKFQPPATCPTCRGDLPALPAVVAAM